MKKTISVILVIMLVCSGLFALDAFSEGYLQGFEDAVKGDYVTYTKLLAELFSELGVDGNTEQVGNSEDYGDWEIYYYVDSFGDYTKDAYVSTGSRKGTFSNSATTNSNLQWRFIIDSDSIAIKLMEYNSYVVKGSSSYPDTYYVQVKDESGNTSRFRGVNSSDRVRISDFKTVLALLRTDQKLKIVIQESTKYGVPSSYNLGTVDLKGFNAIYKKMTGE